MIRQVREGNTVTVSYRGEPVAEIRPIPKAPQTIEERLDELERRKGFLATRKRTTYSVQRSENAGLRRFETFPGRSKSVLTAYVDSSAILAIEFREDGYRSVSDRIGEHADIDSVESCRSGDTGGGGARRQGLSTDH